MRRVLAAAVAMVAVACGPEAPVDTGLDDMGLMAWRGSPQVAIYLDAPGAPDDVVGALRSGIQRQLTPPVRFVVRNYLVPEVLRVHTGYCALIVDTRTESITAAECNMAGFVDAPDAGRNGFQVNGTLVSAAVTRTPEEIRIATAWTARATFRLERWEGPVSITYVLTR